MYEEGLDSEVKGIDCNFLFDGTILIDTVAYGIRGLYICIAVERGWMAFVRRRQEQC